ncbi:MAG: M15 family peptidase [Streptosporangiales bacterium]|nr:M15 family peptidase [Streptosporangiales bacterium]
MGTPRAAVAAVLFIAVSVAGCGSGPERGSGGPPGSPSPTGTATRITPTPAPSPTATLPARFSSEIERIDAATRKRMRPSYRPGCPVPLSELRYLRMTYWGFDDEPHTGEMVVAGDVAEDVVTVFRRLYDARYPIRRMELVDEYEGSDFESIEANNTSAFNCRRAEGSTNWSNHAAGRAIDINPCQNPYVYADGHISHPQCRRYVDRDRESPGMVHGGDVVDRAFRSIGWEWGGRWSGARDYQHFSENGR